MNRNSKQELQTGTPNRNSKRELGKETGNRNRNGNSDQELGTGTWNGNSKRELGTGTGPTKDLQGKDRQRHLLYYVSLIRACNKVLQKLVYIGKKFVFLKKNLGI